MNLIEWNPLKEMDNFARQMGHLLDYSPFRMFYNVSTPKVDIFQTETDVLVKAEIPGVSKEDLNVYVDESSIRLSGETKLNQEIKDENVYRSERYYGSFSRTVPLPVEVISDQAKAEYKDGILTVTIPKVTPAKPKGKKIDVQ